MNVYRGTLKLIASLDRYPVFQLVNWLTRNRLPPMQSSYSSVGLDNPALPSPIRPRQCDAGSSSIAFRRPTGKTS